MKRFPAQGVITLKGLKVTTVSFDYVGSNLRCCFCFSYRHLPSECSEEKPAFFFARHIDTNPGPIEGREARSIVGENQERPAQRRVVQGGPSSSGESSFVDPAVAVGEISERLRSKRNRPRSGNRAAYARHHPELREEGEITPIAEEVSLATTLPEVVQNAPGTAAAVITPVGSGVSKEHPWGLRRWVAKPQSSSRFVDLRESRVEVSQSVGRHRERSDPPLGRTTPVETVNSGKRPRVEGGRNQENQTDLSSAFSLESSRLFKRHMKYAAEQSRIRPWDLNATGNSNQNVNSEDPISQREGAGLSPPPNQCPAFVEEPSGSA